MKDRKSYKLYSLAEWINGMAFRDINFSSKGLPVIKIAEIKSGISSQTKFTDSTYDSKYLVKKGDMLFCWSGQPETSIGTFWWQEDDGWLNQHIFKVLPNENIVTKDFFFYILQNLKPHFVEIARNKQTTGLGHVTKKDLERIDVLIPQFEEQKAIAKILSSLDNKIELNRQMNATLEAIAKTLFKAWFVDFEPVCANSENRLSESASPEVAKLFPSEFENGIPKGWKKRKISQCCDVARGSSPRPIQDYIGDDIPWVKIADATSAESFFIFETREKIKASGRDKSIFLKKGSLILSNSATCGVPMFLEIDGCIHDGWLYFTNYREITSDYLFQALSRMSERLIHEADGTVQKNLNTALISKQEIVVPSPQIMSGFEKIHLSFLRKIKENIEVTHKLSQIRDSLLPRLISGKIPVSKIESEATGGIE